MITHFASDGRVGFVHPDVDNYAALISAPESKLRGLLANETRIKFPSEAVMMIGPLEAALLQVLLLARSARYVLEIGTFTGYSALAMREVLPNDGEIWTFEVCQAHAEVALSYFVAVNALNGSQIKLKLQNAHSIPWPTEPGATDYPVFDAAFIDAEKTGYFDYWQKCKALVRPGGLLIADNTLSNLRKEEDDMEGKAIREFNEYVSRDGDVHSVLTTVRDGMTIAVLK